MADSKEDELEKQIEEKLQQASSRLARRIFLGMVASGIAGGVYVGSGGLQTVARPDPFTGRQGAQLEKRVQRIEDAIHVEERDCQKYRNKIERRLTTVENWIQYFREDSK